jgi:hypothetical protein
MVPVFMSGPVPWVAVNVPPFMSRKSLTLVAMLFTVSLTSLVTMALPLLSPTYASSVLSGTWFKLQSLAVVHGRIRTSVVDATVQKFVVMILFFLVKELSFDTLQIWMSPKILVVNI